MVLNVLPEGASVTVTVVVYCDVPLLWPQVPSLYKVNVSDPLRLASPVRVAVSFGSQSWAVDKCDTPVMTTVSVPVVSGQADAGTLFVFGELPL